MTATSITSRAAAGLVAAVAGYASYRHIVDVASKAGEHRDVAAVLPLAIDGLILVATLAMLDDKRHGRRPRVSARLALVFGVVSTIAANVASAQPSITARLVAAVPAVSFLLAVEVLSRTGKRLPDTEPPVVVDPAAIEAWADEQTAAEPTRVGPWDYAEPIGPPRPPVVEPVPSPTEPVAEPVSRTRVSPRSLTAADRVKAVHQWNPNATHEQVAELAGCSVATVKRWRPKRLVSGSPSGPAPAETAPDERVNGHPVELVEVSR